MILAAFLVGLALVLVAPVHRVVRGLELLAAGEGARAARSATSSRCSRSARRERSSLLAEAETREPGLRQRLERLRVSRAQLDVLLGASRRAQARTRWLRAFLPV